MGRTPPTPFYPIKPDKVEFDELNTWEKFYKDDKENDSNELPSALNQIRSLTDSNNKYVINPFTGKLAMVRVMSEPNTLSINNPKYIAWLKNGK